MSRLVAASQLLMCLGYAAGLVLCVGSDGHVALETMFNQACCTHEVEAATRAAAHAVAKAGCDCVDTPLLQPTREVQISARDTVSPPPVGASPFPDGIQVTLPAHVARVGRVVREVPARRELQALRSVVLLV